MLDPQPEAARGGTLAQHALEGVEDEGVGAIADGVDADLEARPPRPR